MSVAVRTPFDEESHRRWIAEADERRHADSWRRYIPNKWHFVLLPLSLLMVAPFVWMVLSSFMTNFEINRVPPPILPHGINFHAYEFVLANSNFPRWFLNSLIVSGSAVISQMILCSLAGYAFARIPFRGSKLVFTLLLATALIPFQLTVIPTFLIFHDLHLIDSLGALIVPWLTSAFGIYLMSSFFQQFPKELEEAGLIDGCTRLGVFMKVVLPLARPALAALAIITFIYSWNDLFWPLIAINSDSHFTVQVGLATFQGQHRTLWTQIMAGTVLTTLPVLAVFLVGQRRFVQAITGAVKG